MSVMRNGLVAIAFLINLFVPCGSYADQLLKDINTVIVPASSDPTYLGSIANQAIFVAHTADGALGLWRSDGTSGGTSLITNAEFSSPRSPIAFNNKVIFAANSGAGGGALWVTDGSRAGTQQLVALEAITVELVAVLPSNTALLRVVTTGFNVEFWRTDGSTTGTARVAVSSDPTVTTAGVAFGNRIFFQNADSAGTELWVSDGTVGGTHRLQDIVPGTASSWPADFVAMGSYVFFSAAEGGGERNIWRLDTSTLTIQRITDVSSAANPYAWNLTVANGLLFFRLDGNPWRTDGTPQGALQLAALSSPAADGVSSDFVVAGGRVYFGATTPAYGNELWVSDGTAAGTHQVVDLVPGNGLSAAKPLFASGALLFFEAYRENTGTALWVTDGTSSGTRQVIDTFGSTGASSVPFASSGSKIYWAFSRYSYNFPDDLRVEIWTTDTQGGNPVFLTSNVSTDNYTAGFPAFIVTNGSIFYRSADPVYGSEPAASNGSPQSTGILRDIALQSRTLSSDPSSFVKLGNKLLFTANDGINGTELWGSDGTTNGTAIIKDIWPGQTGSSISDLTVIGDRAYFRANDGVHGNELWRTDGTESGTQRVLDIASGADSQSPLCGRSSIMALDSLALFQATNSTAGSELWRSDGTASGTQLLVDIVPGSEGSFACPLAVVGHVMYFTANANGSYQLWKTDGSTAGTQLVHQFKAGDLAQVTTAIAFKNQLIFTSVGGEVWRTDGTDAGTNVLLSHASLAEARAWWVFALDQLIVGTSDGLYAWQGDATQPQKIVTGEIAAYGSAPIAFGTRVAFVATTAAGGSQIFLSDGTAAGTAPATNLNQIGPDHIAPLFAVGPALYFSTSGAQGRQLWRTDGTPAGTLQLSHFTAAGLLDASLVNGQVVMAAEDPANPVGAELYLLPNAMPVAVKDSASITSSQTAQINLLANDADANDSVVGSSVRIIDKPSHGSLSVNSSGIATYVPASGFLGNDMFTYVVSDQFGAESLPAQVVLTVTAADSSSSGTAGGNSDAGKSSGGGGGMNPLLLIALMMLLYGKTMTYPEKLDTKNDSLRRLYSLSAQILR